MKIVKVNSQAELDKALKAKTPAEIWIVGAGDYWISGSVQVTASNSTQVRAFGSTQVTAFDSAQVRASKFVAVTSHGTLTKIDGGVQISVPPILTIEDWCDYHGVDVVDGVAVLYKGLDAQFVSGHGMSYAPGATPSAPDWDGGRLECGGGLHFFPRPSATLRFMPEAKTFVACPVRLSDIRAPRVGDSYPEKLKARGLCAPCFQVDIHGNRIETAVAV